MRAKVVVASLIGLFTLGLAEPAAVNHRTEVVRIRAHFDSVLVELAARDVSGLTETQRLRRVGVTETLRAYRDRGAFPNNYDFPEAPTPYFVDRKTGVLCAVAHLLEATGRRDIVDRVARANNNVWVPRLEGDTALSTWLEQHGLTLPEAARIQVPYIVPEEEFQAAQIQGVSALSSVALGAVGAVNLLTNRDGHGRLRNWIGVASGVANLGVGAMVLTDPNANPAFGLMNVAVGGVGTYLSTRGIFARRASVAARRDAERNRVALAPVLPTSETGAGLSVSIRF